MRLRFVAHDRHEAAAPPSNGKSPLPGGQARRNKLLVSWGPLVISCAPRGLRVVRGVVSSAFVHASMNASGVARDNR
jgi:hypothetical protein